MTAFFIGNGDVSGNEFLDVTPTLTGAFIRPVVLDRVIELTAELQWFCEFPGGGGDFGEGFPHNPRLCINTEFAGTLPQLGQITGDLDATATLTGDFVVNAAITENELESIAELEGFTSLAVFLPGEINAVAVLTGEVRDLLLPGLDPEVLVDLNDGERPCFPLLIYFDQVTHIGNLQEPNGDYKIDLYQAFRMSPAFVPRDGSVLANNGALPNSIGMRVMIDLDGDGTDEEAILFRRPLESEVVVLVDDAVVEKWNGAAWLGYTTLPQRALQAMRAFEVFDPLGAYDYYAKILGLKYVQLQRDTARLIDFIDPQNCPEEFLPVLGDNFGAPIDNDDEVELQRESIRTWIPLMQLKGLDQAVRVALKNLGFEGYATHIWVSPGNPDADAFQERPLGYSNDQPDGTDSDYYPSSSVAIHLNELDGSPLLVIDDGTKIEVATYLKENILPAHVQIRTFTTDVDAGTDDITVDDGNVVYNEPQLIVGIVHAAASAATTTITGSISPVRGDVNAVSQPATVSIQGEVISA